MRWGEARPSPMAARKTVNLRTYLEKIITKAGHETWPRLLQNLRASCETDLGERYPSHVVVAKWLGHFPKVAAAHFRMSREHHFEDVIAGGSKGGASSERGDQTACNANCDSSGSRNGSQRTAQNDRARCNHSACSGFFGVCASYQNWPAAGCRGKKTADRGHGWPCRREESGGDRNRTIAVSFVKAGGGVQLRREMRRGFA